MLMLVKAKQAKFEFVGNSEPMAQYRPAEKKVLVLPKTPSSSVRAEIHLQGLQTLFASHLDRLNYASHC